jgi:hypothetical protein
LPASARSAVSTFTVAASSVKDAAVSARPNSSARVAGMRPAATGRRSVRFPMSRSMSRSSTWLSALAPPHASARPVIAANALAGSTCPRAPATSPQKPVSSSSVMIRGFVSVT